DPPADLRVADAPMTGTYSDKCTGSSAGRPGGPDTAQPPGTRTYRSWQVTGRTGPTEDLT
ncbi:hypothetical protein, partial [Micromonospora sp. TSRI0369]|uniref:hypothetical protein n=1 Tax=Micromonospora sp. TSRI0369 TaxID=1703936 RepID=UPI001A7E049E